MRTSAMAKKHLHAVLFGPQGCGKGTQGKLLSQYFGISLIGTGDLFRAEIAEETPPGLLIKSYVDKGMLVPDELANAIIQRRLHDVGKKGGFILDGYPRNVEQAEALDRVTQITLAIQLRVSDQESVWRLRGRRQCPSCRLMYHLQAAPPKTENTCDACGVALVKRKDDEEDIIKTRLAAYHFMTEPLASYYRQRGVLLAVNGEQSIRSLFDELTRKIKKLGF